MTMGSLFDGSGGFPLAGVINGITPVWASEIEPYPIRVTKARLQGMKHLGSVMDIDGAKIEPVDVVTFGSPCQDLSVAGKQKGIHDGERSSLFFEAVRIAKEMRANDRATGRAGVDVRPRFLVWENVPGAFSSNGGEDFRAVLEALCGIAEDGVSIPRPAKGKWQHAGCVVGDGWSIAWRLYDAQYWGVPQRRKRIYLVADLGSERAGEILFERESLCGDPAEGGEARQGVAGHVEGSVGGSCGVKCLNPWDAQSIRQYDANGIYPTLNANATGGMNRQGICTTAFYTAFHLQQDPINGDVSPCIGGQHQATVGVAAAFKGGQGAKAGGIGYQEDVAPTLTHTPSGTQGAPDVVYPAVARTLTAEHDASPCIDRGQNVVTIDCRNFVSNGDLSGTLQAKSNGGQSLNYQNPVVYSSGSYGSLAEGIGTLGTGTRATAEMVAVYDTTQITSPQNGSKPIPGAPCHTLSANQHPPLGVHTEKTGALCANSHPGSYTGQDAFNDMLPVEMVCNHQRKYIVRRLTPLECCRLQGFPDWWEDGVDGSDSARYKMWGNGIALPCAVDVLTKLAKEYRPCWECKYRSTGLNEPCLHCDKDNNCFEWRGVQKEETT